MKKQCKAARMQGMKTLEGAEKGKIEIKLLKICFITGMIYFTTGIVLRSLIFLTSE